VEGKIIPSIILAAGFIGGIALFGNQVGDGVNALLNKDRIVTVKGLCEKEVKANHVIWPLSFNEMGNDLATVYDNLEKKQATVFEFLKKGGIEPSEISLAAPKVNDTLANNYGPNRPPFRYIITQVITIATDKVDTVRKLMEAQRELLKQGVALTNDYSYMTNYSFTGLNEIKPKMIEIATKNAKEAGLDGVVCSPLESKGIHDAVGEDFLTVTPGIRLASDAKDDQKRVTTPAMAKDMTSSYIVVGRTITKAADPVAAYKEVFNQFQGE